MVAQYSEKSIAPDRRRESVFISHADMNKPFIKITFLVNAYALDAAVNSYLDQLEGVKSVNPEITGEAKNMLSRRRLVSFNGV